MNPYILCLHFHSLIQQFYSKSMLSLHINLDNPKHIQSTRSIPFFNSTILFQVHAFSPYSQSTPSTSSQQDPSHSLIQQFYSKSMLSLHIPNLLQAHPVNKMQPFFNSTILFQVHAFSNSKHIQSTSSSPFFNSTILFQGHAFSS